MANTARNRAEELLQGLKKRAQEIKPDQLWDRISKSDAMNALSGAREKVERRMEDTLQRFVKTLPLATKKDLKNLETEIVSLRHTVDEIKKKASKSRGREADA